VVCIFEVERRLAQADFGGIGGFFLIGGVIMFFDRAMYVLPIALISGNY